MTGRRMRTATSTWVGAEPTRLTPGHALNKILKDMINRYNVIRGRKVQCVAGCVA